MRYSNGCSAGGEPSVADLVRNLLADFDDGVTVEANLVDIVVQASQGGAVGSSPASRGPEDTNSLCNFFCTLDVCSSDVTEGAKVLRASTL